MAKKKPKDVQPGGPFGPIFLGVVSAFLGAGLAFFQLANKSPEKNVFYVEVSAAEYAREDAGDLKLDSEEASAKGPMARRPQTVKYIRGKSSGGRNWKAKREALVTGSGNVDVTVPEVNSWLRSSFKLSSDDAGGFLAIVPSTPSQTFFGSSPLPGAVAGILQSKLGGAFRASEEYEAIREPMAAIASVKVGPAGISLQR